MNRFAFAGLAIVMLVTGCSTTSRTTEIKGESRNIKAAVMGTSDSVSARTTFEHLENGIMANIDAQRIAPGDPADGYDILYLNSSVRDVSGFDFGGIENYVYDGGSVVLDNSLVLNFSREFLGAEELVQLDECPDEMSYPDGDGDYKNIQELLYDYTAVFREYTNIDEYRQYQYGYGIIPSTAEVIAEHGGLGIYTVNKYGNGYVFITNPILPNAFAVTNFNQDEKGEPFSFTTAAADNMLRGYLAEYVSKKKYGFAVERTFGSFATKPASWELHYEDITGIENNSLEIFAELCREYNQIPSYTLVRNSYEWFKRSESLTYLLDDGTGLKNDIYEGAYCSGTHVVSSGKWLELDWYDDTDSYFNDNKEYTKRLYPCPIDWNEDGNIDFICGSADGKFYYFEGYGMDGNYETGVATYLTDRDGNALNVGAYSSPTVFDIDGDGRGELISGSEDGVIRAFKSLKTDDNINSMAFEYVGDVIDTGLIDSMTASGDLNGDGITDIAVGSRDGELRVYYGSTEDGYNIKYNEYVNVVSHETWASPCIYNGELYSGSLEGYIAHYVFNGVEYELSDYLEYDDVSRRGNSRVTIGMNSVPRFADMNNDGIDDLVCGSLEYGMAYPIDSEYFPFEEELKKQLKYCEDNYLYMGVHAMTHSYATPEREALELEYHKKAFEKYGLDWDGVGTNQHTWYTSSYGYDGSGIDGDNAGYNGTYVAQYNSGLKWNSGSMPPESSAVPQVSAENTLPMPMYLSDGDFLMLETSNTPNGNGVYSYTSVKYDMPMLFYNHCDYIYEPDQMENQKKLIEKVDELVKTYNYMFVREDQMAKAAAAIYNTDISAEVNGDAIIIRASQRDGSIALYDEDYQNCIGVKVVFAERAQAEDYYADSTVWRVENGKLYTVVDDEVRIMYGNDDTGLRIEQVNIPADITVSENKAAVNFKDDGLMCVAVEGDAKTTNSGWSVEKRGTSTVFTKWGKAEKLKIER